MLAASGGLGFIRMAAKGEYTMLEVAGHEVRLSNPGKVYFPRPGWTKLDLVEYYLTTAEAVTIHLRERPTVMKRFVNGSWRSRSGRSGCRRTSRTGCRRRPSRSPSGRTAEELVANDAAHPRVGGQPRA
jgi:DNA primase